MTKEEIKNAEAAVARMQDISKQQLRSTAAMASAAGLAYFLSKLVAPEIGGLGLAVAAATGFTVGVWCQPNFYRRNGSLKLAILLAAALWMAPVAVILVSL